MTVSGERVFEAKNSAADCARVARSLANDWSKNSCARRDMFGTCSVKGVKLPDKTAGRQSSVECAGKGNAPVRASYATTARAHKSQDTAGDSPCNCSGDM